MSGEEIVVEAEDLICQAKEDDIKNLNVSEQLAAIFLPMPQADRKLVSLIYFNEQQKEATGCSDKVK